MKKFFFLVMMLASLPAHADTWSKPWSEIYEGSWRFCGRVDNLQEYIRNSIKGECDKADNDSPFLLVSADGYELYGEDWCKFTSKKHAVRVSGWAKGMPVSQTVAHCKSVEGDTWTEKREFFYAKGSLMTRVMK